MNITISKNFNPDLLTHIKRMGLSEQEGLAFCILFENGLEDFLRVRGLLDVEKCEGLIRLNDDGDYVLRFPLYAVRKEMRTKFRELLDLIQKDYNLDSKGHLNNPQDYSVINDEIVEGVEDKLEHLDIEKVHNVVVEYYRTTKPAKKLTNYILTALSLDYAKY